MLKYFIDATVDVIEQEGIENVTIRKVADIAGFTSSTVYNYFKELSHLIFFASMRFMKGYIEELPDYMERGSNAVETWMYSWACFCKHSFRHPKTYSAVFLNNLGTSPDQLLAHYYEIYEQDLLGLPEEIKSYLLEHDLTKRSSQFLQQAVAEGFFQPKDVDMLAESTMLIWKGMMTDVLNQRRAYTSEEAAKATLKYVYFLIEKSLVAGHVGEVSVPKDVL
jgi:AcrR family transcriptional regulator